MKDICEINQDITEKFNYLDEEQRQLEEEEHLRKLSIIDSYEDEIKEILFLSSGCVSKNSFSYKEYGLGLSPDYVNLESLVDKLHKLLSNKIGIEYTRSYSQYYGSFENEEDYRNWSLKFISYSSNKKYLEYFLSIVNKYSKEFYDKEYFIRYEGELFDARIVLVTTKETWKQEYLRHSDTLKRPFSFSVAAMIPILGWLVLLYSMFVAISIYIKHIGGK